MDVPLPNGVVVKDVPEGTTKAQLLEIAIRNNLITKEEAAQTMAPKVSTSVFEPAVPYSGALETGRAGRRAPTPHCSTTQAWAGDRRGDWPTSPTRRWGR